MKLRIIDWEKVKKKYLDELDEMHRRESLNYMWQSFEGAKLHGTISGWSWMYGIVEDALVTDKTFDVPSEPHPKPPEKFVPLVNFFVENGKIHAGGTESLRWLGTPEITPEQAAEFLNAFTKRIRELEEGK